MNGAGGGTHPVEAISALVDGELGRVERATVETHLASCASCRVLLEDLRRLAGAVPEAGVPDLPEGLGARIQARLARESVVPRRGRFALPAAVAATVGAVAILATLHFRPTVPEAVIGTEPTADLERVAPQPPRETDLGPAVPRTGALSSKDDLPRRDEMPQAPPESSRPDRSSDNAVASRTETTEPPPRESQTESLAAPEKEKRAIAGKVAAGAPAAPPAALRVKDEDARFRATAEATPCAAKWRLPRETVWPSPRDVDPSSALARLAREASGSAVDGRDDRGRYVALEIPAAAWPGTLRSLEALGVRVDTDAPLPPEDADCVLLEVRLP